MVLVYFLYQLVTGINSWGNSTDYDNNKVLGQTNNTTRQHGSSTLSNWYTCNHMHSFANIFINLDCHLYVVKLYDGAICEKFLALVVEFQNLEVENA